ncbi:MAG: initiation factor 2B [Desulfurococcaceae archaeon]
MAFTRLTGSELFFSVLDRLAKAALTHSRDAFTGDLLEILEKVLAERPASMATINALREISTYFLENGVDGLAEYIGKMRSNYDAALWKSAEVASRRVESGDRIFTNSNSLAVRRLLKVLRDQNKDIAVYVSESRPGNEGVLIAEYAESLGFNVYLMVDSAVRFFVKDIDKVFVGAEAISANGAVVSKVGTSLVALVAKEARKRVFVVAPTMKFSYETIHGELLKIPEGGIELITDIEKDRELPRGFTARVPLYDVTPAEYVDAVATEYGLVAPQAIPMLLRTLYGTYPPTVASLNDVLVRLKGGSCSR